MNTSKLQTTPTYPVALHPEIRTLTGRCSSRFAGFRPCVAPTTASAVALGLSSSLPLTPERSPSRSPRSSPHASSRGPRSLLRALHALAIAARAVVLLLLGHGVQVLLVGADGVNVLEDADLDVVRVLGDGGHVLRGRQRLHERLGRGGVERGGELDLHDDEEVAELEGRLEPGQPLALARLHQPAGGQLVRVADDVQLAALRGLLRRHGLGVRALLEDGLAVLHHEAADALALELPLLAGLLAHVDVLRLRHRRVLERGHVAVHVRGPLAYLLL